MQSTSIPTIQSFHIPGVQHLPPMEASLCISDEQFLFIDVREDIELLSSVIDVEFILCCAMSEILTHIVDIPRDKKLIIVSENGERSTKIVNLLMVQGFSNVFNLDGGMKAWGIAGLSVKGCSPGQCGSCSCDCS